MTTPAHLVDLQVPLGDLTPYPGNARRGDVPTIVESLREHGQYRPLVVQRSTGYVLAGNHTLQAAQMLSWETVAATYVDCDDEQAKKIVLVDNRTNDLAGHDGDALADLLQALPNLDGTGYTQADLDDILEGTSLPDDDEWGSAMDALPDGDPEVRTRTFTITDEQAALVRAAFDRARAATGEAEATKEEALRVIADAWLDSLPDDA